MESGWCRICSHQCSPQWLALVAAGFGVLQIRARCWLSGGHSSSPGNRVLGEGERPGHDQHGGAGWRALCGHTDRGVRGEDVQHGADRHAMLAQGEPGRGDMIPGSQDRRTTAQSRSTATTTTRSTVTRMAASTSGMRRCSTIPLGGTGICPPGWHVPTMRSSRLSATLGGDGNALKAIGQGAGAVRGRTRAVFLRCSRAPGVDGNFYESRQLRVLLEFHAERCDVLALPGPETPTTRTSSAPQPTSTTGSAFVASGDQSRRRRHLQPDTAGRILEQSPAAPTSSW